MKVRAGPRSSELERICRAVAPAPFLSTSTDVGPEMLRHHDFYCDLATANHRSEPSAAYITSNTNSRPERRPRAVRTWAPARVKAPRTR